MALVMYPASQLGTRLPPDYDSRETLRDPIFSYQDSSALKLGTAKLESLSMGGPGVVNNHTSLTSLQETTVPRSLSDSVQALQLPAVSREASNAEEGAPPAPPPHMLHKSNSGRESVGTASTTSSAEEATLPGNAYSTVVASTGFAGWSASLEMPALFRVPSAPQQQQQQQQQPPAGVLQLSQQVAQHAQQQPQQAQQQGALQPQQSLSQPQLSQPLATLQMPVQLASWQGNMMNDSLTGALSQSMTGHQGGQHRGAGMTQPMTMPQQLMSNPFSQELSDYGQAGSLPDASGSDFAGSFPNTRGYLRQSDSDLDRHLSLPRDGQGWQQQPPSLHGHYINSSPERRALTAHDFNLNKAITKRLASAVHYQQVLEAVSESIALFDEVNVATALHRLAKLQPPGTKGAHSPVVHTEQFKALIDAIHRLVHRFEAQAVSNTLWAFATLGYHPDGKLLDRLCNHAADIIRTFRPQATSNTLWAFAKLAYLPCTAFLDAAIQQMIVDLPRCVPQDISNAAWALATLRHHPGPELMDGASAVAALNMARFKPQEIANTLWAYANLSHDPGPAFLDAAAVQIVKRITHFRAQAVSNSLWAYAKLGFNPGTPLLDCAAKRSAGMLHQHTCQEMANTLWAFATLGHHPGAPVLDAAATQVTYRLEHFSPQDVANSLWAFAELAHAPCPDLLQGAALCLLRGWHRFERRALVTLLWSLALLRAPVPATWRALLDKLAGLPSRSLDALDLRLLFRTHLLLQSPGIGISVAGEGPLLPRDLLEAATSSWQAAVRPNTRDGRMKAEVAAALSALGVGHRSAAVTPDRLFCVDIALDHSQVVLLVEGPSDFAVNMQRPLGRTLARRAELEACGYLVCSIPFFDWTRLNSAELQKRYVFRLLAAALGWRG